MKTITLVAVSIMLATSLANANETTSFNTVGFTNDRFDFNEPISFTERGIEFYVFANGDFDFNTRPNDSNGDYNYRGAGKKRGKKHQDDNFGVVIEQDSFGRVRRVGNTFINYDYADRVSRIGSIYLKYNRFALSQIGGMQLVYNRQGQIIDTFGSIKGRRNGFVYTNYDCNNDYSYTNTTYATNDDDNYYYYRTDGKKAKIKEKK